MLKIALALEGYEVQKLVQDFLLQQSDSDRYSFETPYQAEDGLFVAADIIYENNNGPVSETYAAGILSKVINYRTVRHVIPTAGCHKMGQFIMQ